LLRGSLNVVPRRYGRGREQTLSNRLRPSPSLDLLLQLLRLKSSPLDAARIVEYAVQGSPEADLALREAITEKTERNEPLGRFYVRGDRSNAVYSRADFVARQALS
jgi:hypothetical protein